MNIKKKFYLNSYLMYMLLQGKYILMILGVIAWIEKGNYVVWRCYPKWKIEWRWDYYTMKNDGWEFDIYKELKG